MTESPAASDADRARTRSCNVVFYDGVCALCHRSVLFLLARDRRGRLRFAPLQGETFAAWRASTPFEDVPDSIVYVRDLDGDAPVVFVRSAAVIEALRDIGGVWRLLALAGRLVPRALRDRLYDRVARTRYEKYGRYDACRLPTTQEKERLMP